MFTQGFTGKAKRLSAFLEKQCLCDCSESLSVFPVFHPPQLSPILQKKRNIQSHFCPVLREWVHSSLSLSMRHQRSPTAGCIPGFPHLQVIYFSLYNSALGLSLLPALCPAKLSLFLSGLCGVQEEAERSARRSRRASRLLWDHGPCSFPRHHMSDGIRPGTAGHLPSWAALVGLRAALL